MNIENMKKLKAWFENGAPHFYFDMNAPLACGSAEELKHTMVTDFDLDVDRPIPNTCGSAGCIAGAACVVLGDKPKLTIRNIGASWNDTRDKALDLLGLKDELPEDDFMGHDLFDPCLAPLDCTPAQAAQAIHNVIDGEDPWSDVK